MFALRQSPHLCRHYKSKSTRSLPQSPALQVQVNAVSALTSSLDARIAAVSASVSVINTQLAAVSALVSTINSLDIRVTE